MRTLTPLKVPVNAARTVLLTGVAFIGVFLVSALAHAQDKAEIPPSAPVSVVFVVVFAVVFIGMIVGFFWLLWLNERKRRAHGEGSRHVV
jgi:hypothetical protein